MNAVSDSIAIRIGVAAALLLIVAIAATSLVRMNRFAEGARWVNHTHEVIEGLDTVLSDVISAETGQRGFLLTGDEIFLDPYHASRAELAAHVARVMKLAGDDASQVERIGQIDALIVRRVALLEDGIVARRAIPGRLYLSEEYLAAGRAAMERIRAAIGAMKAEQAALLEERTATFERDRFTTRLIIVAGNAVALVLLLSSFAVMVREIRQRKEAEVRARRYAQEVEDLYNNAPCGYHSLDADGVIVQMNDTELAWLGYQRDEVVKRKRLVDLLTSESRARFDANFVAFKRSGVAHDLEYELLRRDGTTLPVSLSATLVRGAAGEYLMSRSTLFDITERRRAGEELHRANAFLDSVLEHIPNMIFVKDAQELRYVRFNRAGELTLGVSRADLLGKSDYELFAPARAARFVEQDRQVLTTGRMLQVEDDIVETQAGDRILHTRKLPISDESGEPRYLLGISEDITERRMSEQKIAELNSALAMRAQQLEATNQELESFSYSVSHDLRSPLRAIYGFSRILEEDHAQRLDDEGMRLLCVIRSNTQRMARLIDDLLAFSRLGRQALATTEINMTALAREAWNQLCDGDPAARPRLTMGTLPAAVGDPVVLRQVWSNLLSNAIKYSAKRERAAVEVSARAEDGQVTYCVSDNGVGFDMRYSDKLFGVFQRLHSVDEFPGTGVGLAIVKRVINRHGGRVWAHSVLGEGAKFYFTLPERQPDE